MMAKSARSLKELSTDLAEWGRRVERIASKTSIDAIGRDEMAEHALGRVVEVSGEIAGRLVRNFPE